MARYAMQWFVYEGDWHLRHLCHLCRPCHHDMEGGGGHRKVCHGTCRDMGKLLRIAKNRLHTPIREGKDINGYNAVRSFNMNVKYLATNCATRLTGFCANEITFLHAL